MEYSITQLTQQNASEETLTRLDAILAPRVYLVGYELTLADIAVYSSLRGKERKREGEEEGRGERREEGGGGRKEEW